ncbi:MULTISPECIES: macro domain-containing protein [unclassified Actinobaculum]|uniref:macro domain-containing protein n=1 Tax=unclassified Actinobaculum TaxID=2609299 RepID=UPI000D528B95|nr:MULTISPECIES: macro domain-containing protein [unclassified Actinobaculum]AWE43235.1 hypothetical protein DDD63_11325 [Actinobaculum sp. 313]RTE49865.1 macro domain-containing protein [Actinobaculum sp. 352]
MRMLISVTDLTQVGADAIVNAANSSLLGGGGVDGAIHRAAGPQLLAACRELRASALPEGLAVGTAVATPSFNLPARWVIHTVGPNRYAGQVAPSELAACFTNSLHIAQGMGLHSIAFPAIGAGAYGWDMTECATIACRAFAVLTSQPGQPAADAFPTGAIEEIIVAVTSESNARIWRDAAQQAGLTV